MPAGKSRVCTPAANPNRPRDPRAPCLGANPPPPLIAGYFYDSDIGNYYYGQGHPMKPHRIRMAHNLLLNYGLYKKMEIYRPAPASFEEMAKFHSEEYLTFLRAINPDNVSEYQKQMTVRPPPAALPRTHRSHRKEQHRPPARLLTHRSPT